MKSLQDVGKLWVCVCVRACVRLNILYINSCDIKLFDLNHCTSSGTAYITMAIPSSHISLRPSAELLSSPLLSFTPFPYDLYCMSLSGKAHLDPYKLRMYIYTETIGCVCSSQVLLNQHLPSSVRKRFKFSPWV